MIVEDDDGFRTHLSQVLAGAGFGLVEAATGEQALAAGRERSPCAVVLDVCLPGLSGYEVCRELKEANPDLPVLFVSGERTELLDRVAGLLIGGDDYLVKPFAPDELLARLRSLIRRTAPERRSRHELTRRELEVLQLLADGLRQSAIADRLKLSPKTIGTHLHHIFQKLGVCSSVEAVAVAYHERLVEADFRAQALNV